MTLSTEKNFVETGPKSRVGLAFVAVDATLFFSEMGTLALLAPEAPRVVTHGFSALHPAFRSGAAIAAIVCLVLLDLCAWPLEPGSAKA